MPKLYPGKIVNYRWRPGQVRANNVDAAAMVTRVYPDNTVDLTVHPAMDRDPLYQQRVAQMSEAVQGHCWNWTPDDEYISGLEQRLLTLETQLMETAMAKAEAPRAVTPIKSPKRKAA